jgi:hypothetical protein
MLITFGKYKGLLMSLCNFKELYGQPALPKFFEQKPKPALPKFFE